MRGDFFEEGQLVDIAALDLHFSDPLEALLGKIHGGYT